MPARRAGPLGLGETSGHHTTGGIMTTSASHPPTRPRRPRSAAGPRPRPAPAEARAPTPRVDPDEHPAGRVDAPDRPHPAARVDQGGRRTARRGGRRLGPAPAPAARARAGGRRRGREATGTALGHLRQRLDAVRLILPVHGRRPRGRGPDVRHPRPRARDAPHAPAQRPGPLPAAGPALRGGLRQPARGARDGASRSSGSAGRRKPRGRHPDRPRLHDAEVTAFLREVDDALGAHLTARPMPVIVVGPAKR